MKWFQGPAWLRLPEHSWPALPEKNEPGYEALAETKFAGEIMLLFNCLENQNNLLAVLNVERFGTCNKLFRVTAMVLRFIRKLKTKILHLTRGGGSTMMFECLKGPD